MDVAWFTTTMRNWARDPKVLVGAAIVVAGLAWLAFGFFGVHLLFIDDRVDEAPPVFAEAAPQSTAAATTAAPTTVPVVPTSAPSAVPATETSTTSPTTTTAAPATTPAPPTPPSTPPAVATEFQGAFESRDHPTSGNALVLGNGTGQRFLRFESFETDNGPDLNVYLVNSAAGGVDDFVDLGNLKGNIGDQNYEIAPDVDLTVYDTVLIWCVRFSSPFGQATLSPA
jgi:hypothetical protein